MKGNSHGMLEFLFGVIPYVDFRGTLQYTHIHSVYFWYRYSMLVYRTTEWLTTIITILQSSDKLKDTQL